MQSMPQPTSTRLATANQKRRMRLYRFNDRLSLLPTAAIVNRVGTQPPTERKLKKAREEAKISQIASCSAESDFRAFSSRFNQNMRKAAGTLV